jgi:hypothetical protein
MDEHQDLIDLIRLAPSVAPPDNLTSRVMAAVMQARQGVFMRAWHFLSMPRESTLNPIRALHTVISNEERSLYFLLVAFAHLTLGVVLLMGLKNIEAGTLASQLLLLQPWLSLLLAIWLGFWGFFLKINPKAGIKGAKFAALLYVEAVVVNGVLLIMEFKPVLLLIPLFSIVAGIGVACGIFLAISCSHGNKRITEGPTTVT